MLRPFLAALALLSLAAPAHAGLKVCNRTKLPVKAALGRFNGKEWMSEGWWTLPPRHCTALISSRLDARYYYLYATNGGPGSWDGSHAFCVTAGEVFRIDGRADCASRGFDRRGFFEVDTGQKTDYTQNLSD
jgi:uncharacterized membrane protein